MAAVKTISLEVNEAMLTEGATNSPTNLIRTLARLVSASNKLSVMIWGPPGVGKSSIVAQTAAKASLRLVDLRLSQLAPTDLRGLPVARDGKAQWYPPEFLPQDGRGVLFLDEINMAPPAMQGIAQQLILDRKVGSYVLPEGWFVWAAGNRKEDRAAVFDMPAPLANRFIHLTVEPDFTSFKEHATFVGTNERIVAFLAFRPNLLHQLNDRMPAWPSPRSWMMASELLNAGLPVTAAVGSGAAEEFEAFEAIYRALPDLADILTGDSTIDFPSEPSVRYAVTIGLTMRIETPEQAKNAILWISERAPAEWFQLFVGDVLRRMRALGKSEPLLKVLVGNERLRTTLGEFRGLLLG